MKEKEVLTIFKNIGWELEKDEVADYSCLMYLEERQIQIIPTIRERPDHHRVSFLESVSTKDFTEAVNHIFGKKTKHCPIVLRNALPLKVSDVTEDDIIDFSKEIISWGVSQNIEEGLAAYRALPTSAKGAMPLRHLAALAIAKDVEQLTSYKRNFDNGNRLEFVPYIDAGMIERALLIARSDGVLLICSQN